MGGGLKPQIFCGGCAARLNGLMEESGQQVRPLGLKPSVGMTFEWLGTAQVKVRPFKTRRRGLFGKLWKSCVMRTVV